MTSRLVSSQACADWAEVEFFAFEPAPAARLPRPQPKEAKKRPMPLGLPSLPASMAFGLDPGLPIDVASAKEALICKFTM